MDAIDLTMSLKRAKHIRKSLLYDYSYEYFDKEGISFELDKHSTLKYGSTAKGFKRWMKHSTSLTLNKNNDVIVKFCSSIENSGEIKKLIFIKRHTNESLIDELKELFDDIFKQVCKLLNVSDKETFRYYILGAEVYMFLTAEDMIDRINKLEQISKLYFIDDKMKRFINKIIR